MAFDPTKLGATLVAEEPISTPRFDPTKLGAKLVDQQKPAFDPIKAGAIDAETHQIQTLADDDSVDLPSAIASNQLDLDTAAKVQQYRYQKPKQRSTMETAAKIGRGIGAGAKAVFSDFPTAIGKQIGRGIFDLSATAAKPFVDPTKKAAIEQVQAETDAEAISAGELGLAQGADLVRKTIEGAGRLGEDAKALSFEEIKKRLDLEARTAGFMKQVGEGKGPLTTAVGVNTSAKTPEELAALATEVQASAAATDPTNLIGFGAGKAAQMIKPSVAAGVSKIMNTPVGSAVKDLSTSIVKGTTGQALKGAGATLKAGQEVLKKPYVAPVVTAGIVYTAAKANGLDDNVATWGALGSLIGMGALRAKTIESGIRKIARSPIPQRIYTSGQELLEEIPKVITAPKEGGLTSYLAPQLQGAAAGLVFSAPLLLGIDDPEQAAMILTQGALGGAQGSADFNVSQTLNRNFKSPSTVASMINNVYFQAAKNGSKYAGIDKTPFDYGTPFDEVHRETIQTLPKQDQDKINLVRSLLRGKDPKSQTQVYVLPPNEFTKLVNNDKAQSHGVYLKDRNLLVLNRDAVALGHETMHALMDEIRRDNPAIAGQIMTDVAASNDATKEQFVNDYFTKLKYRNPNYIKPEAAAANRLLWEDLTPDGQQAITEEMVADSLSGIVEKGLLGQNKKLSHQIIGSLGQWFETKGYNPNNAQVLGATPSYLAARVIDEWFKQKEQSGDVSRPVKLVVPPPSVTNLTVQSAAPTAKPAVAPHLTDAAAAATKLKIPAQQIQAGLARASQKGLADAGEVLKEILNPSTAPVSAIPVEPPPVLPTVPVQSTGPLDNIRVNQPEQSLFAKKPVEAAEAGPIGETIESQILPAAALGQAGNWRTKRDRIRPGTKLKGGEEKVGQDRLMSNALVADPSNPTPAEQVLMQALGPDATNKALAAQSALAQGENIEVVYNSVESQDFNVTGKQRSAELKRERRAEEIDSLIDRQQARVAAAKNSEKAQAKLAELLAEKADLDANPPKRVQVQKNLQPTGFSIAGDAIMLVGRSLDKAIANAKFVFDWVQANANRPEVQAFVQKLPFKALAELPAKLKQYYENQAHGFRGDGQPMKGLDIKQDPNFKPHVLSDIEVQFLNMLQGEQGTNYADIAALNDRPIIGVEEKTGLPEVDINPLRTELNKLGFEVGEAKGSKEVFSGTTETVRLDRISKILSAGKLDLPRGNPAIQKAGFMPKTWTESNPEDLPLARSQRLRQEKFAERHGDAWIVFEPWGSPLYKAKNANSQKEALLEYSRNEDAQTAAFDGEQLLEKPLPTGGFPLPKGFNIIRSADGYYYVSDSQQQLTAKGSTPKESYTDFILSNPKQFKIPPNYKISKLGPERFEVITPEGETLNIDSNESFEYVEEAKAAAILHALESGYPDKISGSQFMPYVGDDFYSDPMNLSRIPAPAKFLGMQGDAQGGEFPLFNLTADVKGHPRHSTVSNATLKNLGFDRPAGYEGKFMPPVKEKLTLENREFFEKFQGAVAKGILISHGGSRESIKKILKHGFQKKNTYFAHDPNGDGGWDFAEDPVSIQIDTSKLPNPELLFPDPEQSGVSHFTKANQKDWNRVLDDMRTQYDDPWGDGNFVYTGKIPRKAIVQVIDPEGEMDQRFGKSQAHFMPNTEAFYSGLEKTIDEKMPNKASREQILNLIKGTKAEELKWSGIEEKLAEKESWTKPEVLEYLKNEGALKFEEHTLQASGKSSLDEVLDEQVDQLAQEMSEEFGGWENLSPEERESLTDKAYEQLNDESQLEARVGAENIAPTKFAQYQVPGGENYREVVLSWPDKADDRILVNQKSQELFGSNYNELQSAEKRSKVLNTLGPSTQYTSSHFPDAPNYIAHMRLNDRVDANGRPGLFIEEIQSDRHQQGREKGYRDRGDTHVSINMEVNRQVPDAPFRKDWPLQMFKRALRDAIDSGKEWVGWTSGDIQAERYDLSKQIDSVTVLKSPTGKFSLTAHKDGGKHQIASDIAAEKLGDYVGKDLANRIVNDTFQPRTANEYEGQDLKVGGEGMKGFYDKILPSEIGKYVKKFGAKVELADGPASADLNKIFKKYGENPDTWPKHVRDLVYKVETEESPQIWRVDITPEMKASIKEKGQPMFMPTQVKQKASTVRYLPPIPVNSQPDDSLNIPVP